MDEEQEHLDSGFERFERVVDAQFTAPSDRFLPNEVWLPPEPVSVHQILNDAGRVTIAGDGDTYDEVAAWDFVHDQMECIASFAFWSDGVEVYLYRMHDKRCLICWSGDDLHPIR